MLLHFYTVCKLANGYNTDYKSKIVFDFWNDYHGIFVFCKVKQSKQKAFVF